MGTEVKSLRLGRASLVDGFVHIDGGEAWLHNIARLLMPVKDLMVPFMKLSNNMHAESLTKAMGHEATGRPGSWDDGIAAIGGYLKTAGVDPGKIRQVDGSGLSRKDNVAADQYIELLRSVRREPWFDDWYTSLPVACAPGKFDGGTLRTRMCGTPAARNVHAKTGSLTGASALSGYVKDKDGRELVFSIILNNYLPSSVKALEDAIVVTLALDRGQGRAGHPPLGTRGRAERRRGVLVAQACALLSSRAAHAAATGTQ
ncbi:hypothetical protein SALBM135S_06996 [Streptomyces alboniger]